VNLTRGPRTVKTRRGADSSALVHAGPADAVSHQPPTGGTPPRLPRLEEAPANSHSDHGGADTGRDDAEECEMLRKSVHACALQTDSRRVSWRRRSPRPRLSSDCVVMAEQIPHLGREPKALPLAGELARPGAAAPAAQTPEV